jgi:hypothetical protein
MAHPARIPVLLDEATPVICFLTICVDSRLLVLANKKAWAAIDKAVARLDKWHTLALLATPDHIHALSRRWIALPHRAPIRAGSNDGFVPNLRRLGNGSPDVSIDCSEAMKMRSRNGRMSERIRSQLDWQTTGSDGPIK